MCVLRCCSCLLVLLEASCCRLVAAEVPFSPARRSAQGLSCIGWCESTWRADWPSLPCGWWRAPGMALSTSVIPPHPSKILEHHPQCWWTSTMLFQIYFQILTYLIQGCTYKWCSIVTWDFARDSPSRNHIPLEQICTTTKSCLEVGKASTHFEKVSTITKQNFPFTRCKFNEIHL